MSRYSAFNEATGRELAWGYDPPLCEYFFTLYWSKQEAKELERRMDDEEEIKEDPEVVFSIMSHTTTWPHPDYPKKLSYSNAEIADLMGKYPEIPKEHIEAVMADIPY